MTEYKAYMRTPLTDEQVADLQSCLHEWARIREANKAHWNTESGTKFTAVDITKSCLLGRMTMQGKPPLPTPPPTHYSAPWYAVVENNGADLAGNYFQEVEGPYNYNPPAHGKEGRFVMICQDAWLIVAETKMGFVLQHDRLEGNWTLRHRTDSDPLVSGGTTWNPSRGKWEEYYLGDKDWILIGPQHG